MSGLLKWCNRYTRGHDNVEPANDLNVSWGDGLLFCALLHTWFPEKIPMTGRKADTRQEKLDNLALAFKVAEEEANAAPFLDPEDTVDVQDTKSIIVYLNEIYGNVRDRQIKFQASAAWNSAYEAKERKAKEDELRRKMEADKAAAAGLEPPPGAKLDGLAAKMAARRAEEEAAEKEEEEKFKAGLLSRSPPKPSPEEEEEMKRMRAEAMARMEERKKQAVLEKAQAAAAEARKRQELLEKQAAIEREALAKRAAEGVTAVDASEVAYTITGKGAKGGPAKAMLIFTVNITVAGKKPSNCVKTDLEALIEGPSGDVRVNVMGGTGGSFHVGFTPTEAGQHWVDFVYLGAMLNNTHLLEITAGRTCPVFTYSGDLKQAWLAKNGGGGGGGGGPSAEQTAAAEAAAAAAAAAAQAVAAAEAAAAQAAADASAAAAAREQARKEAEESERKRIAAEKAKREDEARKREEELRRKEEEEEERRKEEARDAEAAEMARLAKELAEAEAAALRAIEAAQAAQAAAEAEAAAAAEAARIAKQHAEEAEIEAARMQREIEEEESRLTAEYERAQAEEEAALAAEARAQADIEEADRLEAERLAAEAGSASKVDSDLELAQAALAAAGGDLDEATTAAILEEAKTIADAVVSEDLTSAAFVTLGSLSFSFQAANSRGDVCTADGDASLFVATSNGSPVSVSGVGNGAYHFSHDVVSGSNVVNVTFGGAPVAGFPIQFQVAGPEAALAAAQSKLEQERASVIKEEVNRLVAEKKKEREATATAAFRAAESAKASQQASSARAAEEAAAVKARAVAAAESAKREAESARAALSLPDNEGGAKPSNLRSMFEQKLAQERAEAAGVGRTTSTGNRGGRGGKSALASRWEQTVNKK